MLVSWVKFGSCWGLIRFMLVFWDQFGSSWGLKPDFDDSFTFLRGFWGPIGWPNGPGQFALLSFRGHLTPKWSQIGAQNRLRIQLFGGSFFDHFLDHFWVIFGAIFGTVLGPDRAKKEPRWVQEGIWELQSTKKHHFQKVWFYKSKTILFTSCRLPRWA